MRRIGMTVAILLIISTTIVAVRFVGTALVYWLLPAEVIGLILAFVLPWLGWIRGFALGCALLGTAIGVLSATQAFVAVGHDPEYSPRVPMGAAALVLALAAGVGGIVASRHSAWGSALMLLSGLAGAVAVNLFYINTAYVLAVPFWFVSALLFFAGAIRTA